MTKNINPTNQDILWKLDTIASLLSDIYAVNKESQKTTSAAAKQNQRESLQNQNVIRKQIGGAASGKSKAGGKGGIVTKAGSLAVAAAVIKTFDFAFEFATEPGLAAKQTELQMGAFDPRALSSQKELAKREGEMAKKRKKIDIAGKVSKLASPIVGTILDYMGKKKKQKMEEEYAPEKAIREEFVAAEQEAFGEISGALSGALESGILDEESYIDMSVELNKAAAPRKKAVKKANIEIARRLDTKESQAEVNDSVKKVMDSFNNNAENQNMNNRR